MSIVQKRKIINIFLFTTMVASTAGLIGYFFGYNPLTMKPSNPYRASGMYSMVMTYGYSISISLTGMVTALFFKNKIKKYLNFNLLIVSVIINFIGLYFSYTRGAFFSFIISAPFIFYHKSKKIFWRLMAVSSIIAIIVLSVVLTQTKIDFYRFYSTTSDSMRFSIYKTAFLMIKEKPLQGFGFRNIFSPCKRIQKEQNITPKKCSHAHNNYLEFFSGTGVFGFIFFISFIIFWFRETIKRDDIFSIISLGMIVNFSISGLAQSTIIDGEITFLIMGLYMLSFTSYKRSS